VDVRLAGDSAGKAWEWDKPDMQARCQPWINFLSIDIYGSYMFNERPPAGAGLSGSEMCNEIRAQLSCFWQSQSVAQIEIFSLKCTYQMPYAKNQAQARNERFKS